jgi:hypothetical protein
VTGVRKRRLDLRLAILTLVTAALLFGPRSAASGAVPTGVLAVAQREGTVVWYTSVGNEC